MWFHKVTEAIQMIPPVRFVRGEKTYMVTYVQGGRNDESGHILINYNYTAMWKPFFWTLHFHEFLHRLFWLLKWKTLTNKLDRILDFFERSVFLR